MRKAIPVLLCMIFPALIACGEEQEHAEIPPPSIICTVNTMEQAYRERIGDLEALTPEVLIDLSVRLYHEIKLEGLQGIHHGEPDNLLFEYGTYDWQDGRGKQFTFSVSRQLWPSGHGDEPFELRIVLRYDPAAFKHCGSDGIWGVDGQDLMGWQKEIRATKGHKTAQKHTPKEVELLFYQI